MNILKVVRLIIVFRVASSTRSRPNDFRNDWKPIVNDELKSNDFQKNYQRMSNDGKKSSEYRKGYEDMFNENDFGKNSKEMFNNGCCCCCGGGQNSKRRSNLMEGLPKKPGLIFLNFLRLCETCQSINSDLQKHSFRD